DAVVHHFYEVAGAVRTAVQVALFRGAIELFASWRARDIAASRSKCREDRVKATHNIVFAADHHEVAALQPPYSTARPHADIVDFFRSKFFRPANVVNVERIAAIDQRVARFEMRKQVCNGLVHNRGGNHQPNGPGSFELLDQVSE